VNRKGDATASFLNEIFEKMEVKLMGLEQTVQLLKADQFKEKENLGRIEVNTFKNSEEFRTILSQMNGEFSTRLEVKLTDLVNRLLSE
jgi:FtsZ-binding cell division protein ZapB